MYRLGMRDLDCMNQRAVFPAPVRMIWDSAGRKGFFDGDSFDTIETDWGPGAN